MAKTKVFKCVVCGGDIVQTYVVSCPVRKYCSRKCQWTFSNRNRGTHTKPRTKTKEIGYKRQYNKKYYELNKEAELGRMKNYRRNHQQSITEKGKERRRNNPEQQKKNRERARDWYANNKDKFYGYKIRYRALNDDKVLAQKEAQKAIARGELVREPCEICGAEKTDAHHDDYNKPLEVRWLCRSCHKEWHEHNMPIRGGQL